MDDGYDRSLFVNRELSWLEFNQRVLNEAFDQELPLFERLKFISIYFSNLDEFFMVRCGSLTDLKQLRPDQIDDKTGWTPEKQLEELYRKVEALAPVAYKAYRKLCERLRKQGIDLVDFQKLSQVEELMIEKHFEEALRPILSPQLVDRNHPFPFLKNKDIYVLAAFESKHDAIKLGIIPIGSLEACYAFRIGDRQKVVFTADAVEYFAGKLFHKNTILETCQIRVTRNADITVDEAILDGDTGFDFRGIMETLLKKRRQLAVVRLQLSKSPSGRLKTFLADKLEIEDRQISVQAIPLDFSFGFILPKLLGLADSELVLKPHKPVRSARLKKGEMMKYLEEKDLLLSFPFQSVQPFVELLYEAADDSSVLSIKISLYRLANHSKIVSALAYAAERGKEVLCVLELRARFDEQNNIDYAKILEDAGCTVIYGLSDYKVHAKLCVITRRHHNRISYITQIGTGNYNEKTSEQYTDLSLITSNYYAGVDASNLFKALCLGEVVDHTERLWIAPNCYKSNLIQMIEAETGHQRLNGDGSIIIKVNSLNDMDVMQKLIEASQAGVRVELCVRGICCLRPGIEGYTEHIKIRSIVGKYLEHSRIFCFGKGERMKLYIGSGDLLSRNTIRRVEAFTPIENPETKRIVLKILESCLRDNKKAWVMLPSGEYEKNQGDDRYPLSSQSYLEDYFAKYPVAVYRRKGFWRRLKALLFPSKS